MTQKLLSTCFLSDFDHEFHSNRMGKQSFHVLSFLSKILTVSGFCSFIGRTFLVQRHTLMDTHRNISVNETETV